MNNVHKVVRSQSAHKYSEFAFGLVRNAIWKYQKHYSLHNYLTSTE